MGDQRAAVEADLGRWGPEVAGSALASLALGLADRLDDPDTSSGQAAQLARELRATLLELAKTAPVGQESDGLDELRRMRERRRGAS